MNNAGVAGTRGLSADGFDLTYATNHIGPFLLHQSAPAAAARGAAGPGRERLERCAHGGSRRSTGAVLERRTVPKRSGFPDYGVTKLMNVLHAKELGRRAAGEPVSPPTHSIPAGSPRTSGAHSPHPAQWLLKLFLISNEEGARTQLYCATAPKLATATGRYYDKVREAALQPALGRRKPGTANYGCEPRRPSRRPNAGRHEEGHTGGCRGAGRHDGGVLRRGGLPAECRPSPRGVSRAPRPIRAWARAWLIQADGRDAGYMVVTFGYSMEYGGRDAFIDDLFIRPAYRHAGLGSALVRHARELCAARGVRALHLEVARDNGVAQRVYHRAGFVSTDRQLLTLGLAPPTHGS